jgi:aminopeptidase N
MRHGLVLASFLAAALPGLGPASGQERTGKGFDVLRYQLALTPDVAAKTIAGREVITLRPDVDGLRHLRFSANALSIERAVLDGAAVIVSRDGNSLDLELARPLRRGHSVKLELSYRGRPARGFAGSPTMLYTSYFACDWMICGQDDFGDKADFALDLHVPAGMTSLSVGTLIKKRSGPGGDEIHHWETPRPYSAYLFGFAVGRFARTSSRVGSRTLTYLSDVADAAALNRRLAPTADMVTFLAGRAGLPLPAANYTQLLVAGDEAQEAATYSVLGLDAVPAQPADAAKDWAIVHELAHQWWGNLVTCTTLQDFWLNEGITTFMTAAWKEHRYGSAAYQAELQLARQRLDRARVQGYDKPLAWSGRYPDLRTRRAVQYSKGALFMAHLREALGEKAFWAGLRRYTRAHAGGTVISIDLQRAFEASSGRDLQPLFARWVYGDPAP